MAREVGLLDADRGDSIIRAFGSNGTLVSESAAVGDAVVARLGGEDTWHAAKRSDYAATLQSIANAGSAGSTRLQERELGSDKAPTGWTLGPGTTAIEVVIPGRSVNEASTAARVRAPTADILAISQVDPATSVIWRRWWRAGRLVAEESRLAIPTGEQGGSVDVIQSTVFAESNKPLYDVLANALASGWDEIVAGIQDGYAQAFPFRKEHGEGGRNASFPGVPEPNSRHLAFKGVDTAAELARIRALQFPFKFPPEEGALPSSGLSPQAVEGTLAIANTIGFAIYLYMVSEAFTRLGQAIAKKVSEAAKAIQNLPTGTSTAPSGSTKSKPNAKTWSWDRWARSIDRNAARWAKDVPAPPIPAPDTWMDEVDVADMVNDWSYERHHVATDKSSKWTQQFEDFLRAQFGDQAPDLDDDWNTMYARHSTECCFRGHSWFYHLWVLQNMEAIANLAQGDVEKFKTLWQRVKAQIYRNPAILSCCYFRC